MRLDLESLPEPTATEHEDAKATSVTGLVTLARCPQQFRWAFVDRLPMRPSPALRRGVAFHRKVELHNLGKVPLDDLDETTYDLTSERRRPRRPPDADPYEVFLASRLADRPARFAEVPIDLQFGNVRVRGRIDAVYEPSPGEWEIVDYKSGRTSEDPSLDVQLQTYAVAAADGAVATPVPDRLTVTFAFFGGGEFAERTVAVDDAWLAAARIRIDELTDRFDRERFRADAVRSVPPLRLQDVLRSRTRVPARLKPLSDLRHATVGDVEDNRDRTVVDEVDDHMCAETTVLHGTPVASIASASVSRIGTARSGAAAPVKAGRRPFERHRAA